MGFSLDTLNARQREAVLYEGGGALVLAGAGTGKTRVLTGKIIHLIDAQQVNAGDILAVTFTNKAAKEMKTRIEEALPFTPRGLLLGTFHSICHRLLRVHADPAGLDKNFQILDSQDQLSFIRRLLRAHDINDEEYPANEVRNYITAAKERGYRAAAVPSYDDRSQAMRQIYRYYEDACGEESKVDFAELMLAVTELWRNNDDLRQHYAKRFRYILVDELQDTNRQQFEWLKMLDSGDNCFFAVGDDDQSIYAFRGAEPAIMQEFQSRLRADKLIRLEENYRSVNNILQAANHLIRGNRNRLGKTLVTNSGDGDLMDIVPAASDQIEAKKVAQMLDYYIKREGGNASDAAILYRTNAQGRLFEKALMEYGVPYRVYGGLRFYDRQEIKNALAYLRLIAMDDRDALLRVLNVPPRGIGQKTIEGLGANDELFTMLRRSTHKSVSAFNLLIEHWRQQRGSLADTVRTLLEDSRLLAYYEERKEMERVENLRELVNAAAQFENNYRPDETDSSALTAFLATAALESGGENADDSQQAVNLMTVHAAKGLEFPRVCIVGLEEGIFPHQQSLDSKGGAALEEERRLLYVAITRAQEKLSLHFAGERMLCGRAMQNPSSRFLRELPARCLSDPNWEREQVRAIARTTAQRNRYESWTKKDRVLPMATNRGSNSAGKGYHTGDRVRHKRYGIGVVLRQQGSGKDEQIEVAFKKNGRVKGEVKSFKTALAPLEKA
ncbi:MAG: UvrD-helicase domain-containing protein [Proteobacteria bacterium]|nr:UvrD-helicase domain-containing protein [Pseudomonadota bacterium]